MRVIKKDGTEFMIVDKDELFMLGGWSYIILTLIGKIFLQEGVVTRKELLEKLKGFLSTIPPNPKSWYLPGFDRIKNLTLNDEDDGIIELSQIVQEWDTMSESFLRTVENYFTKNKKK